MAVNRLCKDCNRSIIVWNTAQTRCAKCQLARSNAKPPKPISKRGKQTRLYETFRDKVAIPHLDKKYGHVCSVVGCDKTDNLDVDHILTRGAHPELKFDVKNLRYVCRPHHRQITDGEILKFKRR